MRKKKTAWSAEQIRNILKNTLPECTCLFTCIALTGLRIGELLALQWNHIDFESHSITVQQNLWRGTIVAPKTQNSFRTLPIGEVPETLLANHKRGSQYSRPDDFVFCSKSGSNLNPDVLRKDVLYPILDRLQIPRPKRSAGFHAFRHSAASLIHDRTGSLKLAQDLLGHANLDTTADTYTHPSKEAQREAYEVLEQAFFSDLFPIVPKTGNRNRDLVKS